MLGGIRPSEQDHMTAKRQATTVERAQENIRTECRPRASTGLMRYAKAAKSRDEFHKSVNIKDKRVCSRYREVIDGTDADVGHWIRGNSTFLVLKHSSVRCARCSSVASS